MANSIVITINETGRTSVVEEDGSKYVLPEEVTPFLNDPNDDFVQMRNSSGSIYVTYTVEDVEKVIYTTDGGEEFIINDSQTLYDALAFDL